MSWSSPPSTGLGGLADIWSRCLNSFAILTWSSSRCASRSTRARLSGPPCTRSLRCALERSLIVERVKAGLRRARAEGKRLGRPRLRVDEHQLRVVANQKLPVRAAAKALGVSPSSYLRLVRSQAAAEAGSASHA